MSSGVPVSPVLRKRFGQQLQRKMKQWQVTGVGYYPDFLSTSHFRQLITLVFLFLIMMLGSIMGFSLLSETLIRTHVHDVILNDIYDFSARSRLNDSHRLTLQLQQVQQDSTEELPLVMVIDKQGQLLYHNMGLKGGDVGRCHRDVECLKGLIAGEDRHNIIGLSVQLEDGGVFFRAYNVLPMLERIRTIPLLAGTGLFIVLISCLLLSRRFSLHGLNTVRQIREALHRYSTGEQQVRMPISLYGNDFDGLSADINQNLERIDRLMEQVRSTSSHIAHELRTPLTHLQNRLYNLGERVDLGYEVQQEIHLAVSEAEKILSLFRAVMRIGEIESGRCVHQFENISVQQLLQDLVEYYQPLAEVHHCHLLNDVNAAIQLFGDKALVFQAMANLIENALKYAAQGESITLGVRLYHGWIALYVGDHGPGIPEHLYEKATARFQRLEEHHQQSGHGLGLSLVKAIAELHGGKLYLESGQPGLNVYLCLNRC